MGHLINPIEDKPSIGDCLLRVREAHRFLICAISLKLKEEIETDAKSLGSAIKRIRITLPVEGRPADICQEANEENFTEIINQCANVERLIAALEWSEKEFPNFKVHICHPTTSSGTSQNDLELVSLTEERATFEIFDVVSPKNDGNGKESKNLKRLGVTKDKEGGKGEKANSDWPKGNCRYFLVVSSEFGARLQKKKICKYKDHFHYFRQNHEENADGTHILEVKSGKKSEGC